MQNLLSPTDKVVRCDFDQSVFYMVVLNENREEITITITPKDDRLELRMSRTISGGSFEEAVREDRLREIVRGERQIAREMREYNQHRLYPAITYPPSQAPVPESTPKEAVREWERWTRLIDWSGFPDA